MAADLPDRPPTGSRSGPASTWTPPPGSPATCADLGVSHLYIGAAAGRHARLRARLRRRRPPRGQPGAGRRGGPAAAGRARCAQHGSAWSSTSCPTTSGVAVPAANPAWWDVLRRGRDSAYADWFDIDWDARPAAAAGARPTTRTPSTTSRSSTGSCATTSTASRSPTAPATAPPREVHDRQHYELVSWRRGDDRAELPPVLRRHRAWPACGSRTRRSSPPPTPRSCAGSPPGRSTASASTTRTACATPAGYLARLRAAAPDAWLVVEKILEHGEELPALAGRRHHRLRRPRRGLRPLRRPGAEATSPPLDTR